jgi:hypothetical protein
LKFSDRGNDDEPTDRAHNIRSAHGRVRREPDPHIFRLIAVDERQVYRQPTEFLPPMPPGIMWGDPFYWYYYPHWHYYWHWRSSWAVTRSRGYWEEYTYVIVESSLYDNETDRLVFTAKSETLDGERFDRLAASVANEITDNLVGLDLVAPSGRMLALGEDVD